MLVEHEGVEMPMDAGAGCARSENEPGDVRRVRAPMSRGPLLDASDSTTSAG